jgi:hypothetical protein
VQRAILISFFSSSYYDFELNVCAREHLSCVIHLHFDLLYIFLKETKGKKKERERKSNQAKFIFHFHSYELLIVTTLGATLFLSFVFFFFIRCDADIILLWEVITIQTIEVGMSVWFPLYLLLSFNIDSLSFMPMMKLFLVFCFFFFTWKIHSYLFLKTHIMQTSNFNRKSRRRKKRETMHSSEHSMRTKRMTKKKKKIE